MDQRILELEDTVNELSEEAAVWTLPWIGEKGPH